MKTNRKILFLLILYIFSTQILFASDNYKVDGGLNFELGGLYTKDNRAMGGGCGPFFYLSDYLSFNLNVSFLGSDGIDDYFFGSNIGLRCDLRKRFSPFIGLGVLGGYVEEYVPAENDQIDNDDNGYIDEPGEEKEVIKDILASIYPEIGLYYWIDDKTRLNLFGRYHYTTKGRDNDFWLYTIGLSIVTD